MISGDFGSRAGAELLSRPIKIAAGVVAVLLLLAFGAGYWLG